MESGDGDAAVSTYHLASLALSSLRAQGLLDCPAVTFITTFSVHELWLHPGTDAYLCIARLPANPPDAVAWGEVAVGHAEIGTARRPSSSSSPGGR